MCESTLWSYGVVVITSDFESDNLGSTPSKTFTLTAHSAKNDIVCNISMKI